MEHSSKSEKDFQEGECIGACVSFRTSRNEEIMVKIGVSFISMEQAKKNLTAEIPDWDFEKTKNDARKIWNDALGRIRVEGGTQRQKTIFYTALYRVMLGSQSIDLTEQGGRYYSRFDKQVHETGGHNFYKVGSNWGSHHSLFPLCLLIEPEIQNDLMRSYVRMQQEGDWLVNSGGFRNMIGRHETATITDAYMKGYRDFDIETAYEAMKRNSKEATMLSRPSTNDWRGWNRTRQGVLGEGILPGQALRPAGMGQRGRIRAAIGGHHPRKLLRRLVHEHLGQRAGQGRGLPILPETGAQLSERLRYRDGIHAPQDG